MRKGLVVRFGVTFAFLWIILNPSILEQKREVVRDTGLIVFDDSFSQSLGERAKILEQAQSALVERVKRLEDIDIRILRVDGKRETRLFESIDQALSDGPLQRRAGIVIVTDGQIHDIPQTPEQRSAYGPVHVLLTGKRSEQDRQLVVVEAPSYGIVGQNITIRYRVEDNNMPHADRQATILLRDAAGKTQMFLVPVGQDQNLTLPIHHGGQNIFEIEASPVDGEITHLNNKTALIVNGVRDRLKVLLVSGQPHAGERTWRDLLTSDPGVDLVHFTILREPQKVDLTPQDELSLIAFPFRELFEIKIYDFDLIIFDRYSLNRILPNYYFNNIATYVRKGGALLEASGPSFATEESVYTTAIGDILPAAPGGSVIEAAFTPALTDLGRRHPVTQGLDAQKWGPWLRHVGIQPKSGDIVMTGHSNQPLLVLDRVGEGRVAQLASDQIWLWSRGFMGGGPHADLLRRLAHWLMKEPELEENALELREDGDNILVRRRNLHNAQNQVTLTRPDGTRETLTLQDDTDGWLGTKTKAGMDGVYQVDDGTVKRFALIGPSNPPELRSVLTTDRLVKPMVQETGGRIMWIGHDAIPELRRVSAAMRVYGGSGWVGFKDNKSYAVTGIHNIPLVPTILSLAGLLFLLVAGWWWEGRGGQFKAPINRIE
jgi:hypothetical protein